ncbi:MAG: class I SAM-dependent methyltransferase [Saprospiraceae bacterium]|nr:class I SAM-dependent methyltransferase [Saprospiraceae bacterium]
MKTIPTQHDNGAAAQIERMRRMYRRYAPGYDATRWAFLHGRQEIVRRLELPQTSRLTLMEIGCGTGKNLTALARLFPGMQLIGVDVSPDMLDRAARACSGYSRQVRLIETPYPSDGFSLQEPVDLILFSYSLTLFNPGWEAALDQAYRDLRTGGRVAVVDFHHTQSSLMRWWMDRHHVRIDGHLLPALQARFETQYFSVRSGGLGLWQYFLFVGGK